ncbi:MAG: arginase [Chloroflexi bacterium]|nr:arginase [Chloroflexota bacterium]
MSQPPSRGSIPILSSDRADISLADVTQRKAASTLPSRFHAVHLIGVPMDLGASRRGVDMGPSAVRIAGLQLAIERMQIAVEDRGNIPISLQELAEVGDPRQRYLTEIAAAAKGLAKEVQYSLERGGLPIALGGDHSIALGSIAGASAHYRNQAQKIGLIWLDAHGDLNTAETTPSGNIHGMPLAATLGFGDSALTRLLNFGPKVAIEHCALVGVRELDPGERDLIRNAGLRVFPMSEIDVRGMSAVIEEAITIATRGTAGFHASMDIDFVDPVEAAGVGTPVRGGATYRESHLAMEHIAAARALVSMDMVEINPVIDTRNHTAELAVELITSALGKVIL